MNTLEDNIRNAVAAEDESLLSAGDEGLFQQVAATFHSRMRYWVALIWFATTFMTALAVWAAVAFFQAETTQYQIMDATLFFCAFMAIGMLKMWYWMEMNRNTHTRELKRVEIQIAKLAEIIDKR